MDQNLVFVSCWKWRTNGRRDSWRRNGSV